MHREGGEHEVRRRIVQSNVSASWVTAKNCTQADLASWTPGYHRLWARTSVDHLSREFGKIRCGREFGEDRCGNIDFRIEGLPHSTVQQQDGTRKEAVKKLIHQVETHPIREALKADLEKDQSFNPFSEKSMDMIPQHGKYGVLRDVRDHCQGTVPQLFNILDDRHCTLYLRNMLATFRQKSQIKQRSIWCFIDSELRDKERTISRCTSRKNREANNLVRSSHRSKERKEEAVQIHIRLILVRPSLSKIANRHRMGRRILRPLRRDCSRRSLFFRDTGRAEQKRKFLEACTKHFG